MKVAALVTAAVVMTISSSMGVAQSVSPNGVKTLTPEGAIKTTGTWDVGTRAGDFIYIAGMRASIPRPTPSCGAIRTAFARPFST